MNGTELWLMMGLVAIASYLACFKVAPGPESTYTASLTNAREETEQPSLARRR